MTEASVALLGVKGGPAIRPGSNMPTSILVKMGGKTILVDAGLGAARGVCDQGVLLEEIDLVIITHLHSDHYLELGPLFHTAWVSGKTAAIPVIGPSGLAHYWKHFCAAMEFDISLRIADEGRSDFAALADLSVIQEGDVFDDGRLIICAMKNDHPPIEESFALRFEADGKVLVLSGDTAFMDGMIDFSANADVLVHEVMHRDGPDAILARMKNGDERLKHHLQRSHTLAQDVGKIASSAKVSKLALNHYVPDGLPGFTADKWEAAVRETWTGDLVLGEDGMRIEF